MYGGKLASLMSTFSYLPSSFSFEPVPPVRVSAGAQAEVTGRKEKGEISLEFVKAFLLPLLLLDKGRPITPRGMARQGFKPPPPRVLLALAILAPVSEDFLPLSLPFFPRELILTDNFDSPF